MKRVLLKEHEKGERLMLLEERAATEREEEEATKLLDGANARVWDGKLAAMETTTVKAATVNFIVDGREECCGRMSGGAQDFFGLVLAQFLWVLSTHHE